MVFSNFILEGTSSELNWWYLLHTVFRAVNFHLVFWSSVKAIYYANLADLNFGIISSCSYVSIIVNSVVGYFFFREIITPKMLFGILVTITGILWVSLAKGGSAPLETPLPPVENLVYNKVMSVLLALLYGTLNAVQTI